MPSLLPAWRRSAAAMPRCKRGRLISAAEIGCDKPLAASLGANAANVIRLRLDVLWEQGEAFAMPLVAGNWKMNGSLALVGDLVGGLTQRLRAGDVACEVCVCPPAHLISAVVERAGSGLAVGGQDCSAETGPGAFTGEISAEMLAASGCRHVIVGHSERRERHAEGNGLVRAKAERALEAGLAPIVCVGETRAEREAGEAIAVVSRQLRESLPDRYDAGSLVVAYEPVWAIGTGLTATIDDIAEIHQALGAVMGSKRAPILYGGSVKPGNAAEILGTAGVDGALVGGASLKLEDFWAIVQAA